MHVIQRSDRWLGRLTGIALASLLLTGACTDDTGERRERSAGTIPQPAVTGITVAPERERVDISAPSFSDPTNVTNPLFPISRQASVLLLGQVDGAPFRTEVTLLPDTRFIEWRGQPVETLVSQYVAFLDGRLHEVAYDFYAQADDGSVWYFGEDVFNFRNGVIADTHGTWIAGKDGPAAMIMPAHPNVGDTYRPENIPGFVFEEVTVESVGESLVGPLGQIDGGIVVQELHMDGALEDKTFAPGYGEFYTSDGKDVEALALAVPTDALSEPLPTELETIETGALGIFEAAGSGRWREAATAVDEMSAAWTEYSTGDVPRMIEPRMAGDLGELSEAVRSRDTAGTRQASIDVAQWALDLQLRYLSPVEVDRGRFDLWLAQLVADAEAGDADAVNGDFFTLDYIRDRILPVFEGADAQRVNALLEELQGAVGDRDLEAATQVADELRKDPAIASGPSTG
jgi:hypothetical protein